LTLRAIIVRRWRHWRGIDWDTASKDLRISPNPSIQTRNKLMPILSMASIFGLRSDPSAIIISDLQQNHLTASVDANCFQS